MQSRQNKEEPSFDRRKTPKVSKHWICLRKSRGEQKVPARKKKQIFEERRNFLWQKEVVKTICTSI